MKIRERLLECKVKTGIKSDYKLAEVLGTSRQIISALMQGKQKPDAYIAVKIGLILNMHPLLLLAEFEAENAKTAERRGFWENFAQRIKIGAVGMLALIFTAFWLPVQKAEARGLDTHNVYYVKYPITAGCCSPSLPCRLSHDTAAADFLRLSRLTGSSGGRGGRTCAGKQNSWKRS